MVAVQGYLETEQDYSCMKWGIRIPNQEEDGQKMQGWAVDTDSEIGPRGLYLKP